MTGRAPQRRPNGAPPTPDPVWNELGRLTDDARARGHRPELDAETIVRAKDLLSEIERRTRAERVLPQPQRHVLSLIGAPPDVHIPTGLDTLDEITEGGLLSGRFHVIAGEPNLGKTSIATQLARYACEEEFIVGFHVADVDDRRGIILRIAQAHGIDRRAFLAHDQDALLRTVAILDRWPLFSIIDEAADNWTVEETAEALLSRAAATGHRPVMFVDSLQTVRLRWSEEPRTDKDRIDRVVRALVGYTRRGLVVIATCEVPRSVYSGPKRSRRAPPAPPAMAAFKGTGNIEYALWTGLVLTRIRGEPDAVRVEVPKNKQGREGVTFKLVRTESRVGYEDAGELLEQHHAEADEPVQNASAAFDAKVEKQARDLLPNLGKKLVKAGPVGLSLRQIRERLIGKNAAKDLAVELALAEGTIVGRTVKGGHQRFFAPSAAPPLPTE